MSRRAVRRVSRVRAAVALWIGCVCGVSCAEDDPGPLDYELGDSCVETIGETLVRAEFQGLSLADEGLIVVVRAVCTPECSALGERPRCPGDELDRADLEAGEAYESRISFATVQVGAADPVAPNFEVIAFSDRNGNTRCDPGEPAIRGPLVPGEVAVLSLEDFCPQDGV